MARAVPLVVTVAVEGPVDEAVVRRLLVEGGATLGDVHGRRGKDHLLRKLNAYNRAAQFGVWVVLVDLDRDAECAPPFCARSLPKPARLMCFWVAVRAVEAWLMADTECLAAFLGISVARIPRSPEQIDDPKRTLVELAKRSRRRAIRESMLPQPGSGRAIGPLYNRQLIAFVQTHWRPEAAARQADSLLRCRDRLRELVERSS